MNIARYSEQRGQSPLDLMSFSVDGLYPLPVEIWRLVFALATSESLPAFLEAPFSPIHREDLRDLTSLRSKKPVSVHHSIILVCKSWYFVDIPALWSHLHLNDRDSRNTASVVYDVLGRTPSLASHVRKLTVRPVPYEECYGKSVKPQAIEKVLPLLINLESITCNLSCRAKPPSNLQLKKATVYSDNFSNIHQRVFWHSLLQRHDQLWYHCEDLSFYYTAHGMNTRSGLSQIHFRHLVTLRLFSIHPTATRWIADSWDIPVLKNLFIFSHKAAGWNRIFQRVRLTLETAQIPIPIRGGDSNQSDTIIMPKLRFLFVVDRYSLHLNNMEWYTIIQAPRLQRLGVSIGAYKETRYDNLKDFTGVIDGAIAAYKSIEEMTLIVARGKWTYMCEILPRTVLTTKHIERWCARGIVVEIITGLYGKSNRSEEDKRRFTIESIRETGKWKGKRHYLTV